MSTLNSRLWRQLRKWMSSDGRILVMSYGVKAPQQTCRWFDATALISTCTARPIWATALGESPDLVKNGSFALQPIRLMIRMYIGNISFRLWTKPVHNIPGFKANWGLWFAGFSVIGGEAWSGCALGGFRKWNALFYTEFTMRGPYNLVWYELSGKFKRYIGENGSS